MPNSHEKTDRQKIRVETKSRHILAIGGEIQPYQDIMRYDSEDTDDRWLLSGVHATEWDDIYYRSKDILQFP